jgi:phosphoribosylanthranilate isomerase
MPNVKSPKSLICFFYRIFLMFKFTWLLVIFMHLKPNNPYLCSIVNLQFKYMSLNTFVYIRDVNNLSDARYCAGMGVDMIGFRLDTGTENYLDASKFREITDWISGVKIVGEFGNMTPAAIRDAVADYKVDYLLVDRIALLEEMKDLRIPMILSARVDKNIDEIITMLNFTASDIDYLLLQSEQESISDHQKTIIGQLSTRFPILLGFGIDETNASGLVTALGLEGISIAGGQEIRPGLKDYDVLADILESLEMD